MIRYISIQWTDDTIWLRYIAIYGPTMNMLILSANLTKYCEKISKTEHWRLTVIIRNINRDIIFAMIPYNYW